MIERKDLETAAATYSYLRGLFYIPGGALLIVAALANSGVGLLRHVWAFPVAAGLLGLMCLRVARYYNDHYGRLNPSPRQQLRAGAAVLVALVVMGGGSTLMRSRASWSLDLPVNAIAVSFALVMLVSYAVGVGLKVHHVLIWGALLVTGALPVWDGADPSNIGLALAGAALMVSGLFDHHLFVRTFGAAKEPLEVSDV